MNQLLNQKNLPYSDVSKYGIFLRNVLISNIEQEIKQKCAEVQNLYLASQQIKLQSSQSNENEKVQRMLFDLKEQLLKVNYSDLQVQIEMALAQTEITETFSLSQNMSSFSNQNLSNSISQFPISPIQDIEVGISKSIKSSLNTDQTTEQSFPNSTLFSSNLRSNGGLHNRIFENISDISHQTEEDMMLNKKDTEFKQNQKNINSLNEIKEEYTESNETRNQYQMTLQRSLFDQGSISKKEEDFQNYLEKLMKFESNNNIYITPFFKDKDQFFYRFRNKGVAIHNRLKEEDKQLIWELIRKFNSQIKVGQLLEIPHQLVSKLSILENLKQRKECSQPEKIN